MINVTFSYLISAACSVLVSSLLSLHFVQQIHRLMSCRLSQYDIQLVSLLKKIIITNFSNQFVSRRKVKCSERRHLLGTTDESIKLKSTWSDEKSCKKRLTRNEKLFWHFYFYTHLSIFRILLVSPSHSMFRGRKRKSLSSSSVFRRNLKKSWNVQCLLSSSLRQFLHH